eukprot:288736-Rhodomonas_salina.3
MRAAGRAAQGSRGQALRMLTALLAGGAADTCRALRRTGKASVRSPIMRRESADEKQVDVAKRRGVRGWRVRGGAPQPEAFQRARPLLPAAAAPRPSLAAKSVSLSAEVLWAGGRDQREQGRLPPGHPWASASGKLAR